MSESTLGRLPAIVVSSRLTLAGSLLLGAGLVWQQIRPEAGAWAVTLSLLVLGTNLLAALLWDKRLRGHPALFLFHVGLLLIGVLAGWGQLAEFKGRLVLAEGQQFHPSLVETVEHGPMHPSLPQEGRFRQGAVAVDYRAGMHRGRTHSQLRFADGRDVHVGDDIPLLVDGYRFYTTSNKGFAAYLEWTSSDGTVELGVVHLPSYPIREMTQFNRWRTPAGEDLEFSLDLPVIERGQDWRLSRDVARETPLLIRAAGRPGNWPPASVWPWAAVRCASWMSVSGWVTASTTIRLCPGCSAPR